MAHVVATMVEIVEQYQLCNNNQIQSFLDKARSFRDVVRKIPCQIRDDLEIRIIDSAHKAEDLIESHIIKEFDTNVEEFVSQLDLLIDIVQEFESIMNEIKYDDPELQPSLPLDHLSSEQVPWYPNLEPRTKDDVSFIFQDDFRVLKGRLIEEPSKLQIIAIRGMFGMGKRTLARRLYNDHEIATHFRVRAWVSPSPFEINPRNCLLKILEGLGMLTKEMQWEDIDKLKVMIRNALKHVKYFIVIHDVLLEANLVTFTRLFRDYGVGARVLFTTIDDATLSTYAELYQMPLLTDDESWRLLRQKVFGREYCPYELEHIGKIIMQLCGGSPQLVSLVAGVLATSDKTSAVWELVATTLDMKLDKDADNEDEQVNLLLLIYYHLPHYLRPCLLYTGVFYESHDIKASMITKLWIAEGFVKQSTGECLEDVAETYLRILIDKNLLYLTHEEPNGKVKAFQTQVYLKFGYWIIANHEKFVGSKYLDIALKGIRDEVREEKLAHRISAHGLFIPSDEMKLPSLARSFLSVSNASRRQVDIYLELRMLRVRVLEVFQLEFYQFPMEIMQKVLLRYLSLSCHSNLPNSFSILRNLQTLIVRRVSPFRAFSLPSDLWGLTQLRHVKCKETFVLIHPKNGKEAVHENLQTLSKMQLFGVTNQFLGTIPNLRNLGIFCNIAMGTVFDLACLAKLEMLKCSSDWSLASRNFLSYLTLPQSLRKLTLCLCRIPSKFMKLVGTLPNLELLKLQKSDFVGVNSVQTEPKWELAEGEFPQLLSLEMADLNLMHWKANATHFPKLKLLIIRNCYAMAEIPLDIGNIQTLEMIQVNETSPSALVSAMLINKEQESRGNKFLQVRTHKVV